MGRPCLASAGRAAVSHLPRDMIPSPIRRPSLSSMTPAHRTSAFASFRLQAAIPHSGQIRSRQLRAHSSRSRSRHVFPRADVRGMASLRSKHWQRASLPVQTPYCGRLPTVPQSPGSARRACLSGVISSSQERPLLFGKLHLPSCHTDGRLNEANPNKAQLRASAPCRVNTIAGSR